jgi:magnesium-transporting ATPase (P-type)
VKGYLFVD